MAIKGKESLFYIDIDGVYFPVGCLTSSPLSEDVQMLNTTTRENDGWVTELPTTQSYTIALDGLMVMDDEDSGSTMISYRKLRQFKRDKTLINWKRETLNGYYIDKGRAHIVSISDADPADGFITFQASLKGFGKPEEDSAKIYVLGNVPKTQLYTHPDGQTLIQTEE